MEEKTIFFERNEIVLFRKKYINILYMYITMHCIYFRVYSKGSIVQMKKYTCFLSNPFLALACSKPSHGQHSKCRQPFSLPHKLPGVRQCRVCCQTVLLSSGHTR